MRIFDPHAHMTSRTTDDYEAMAASGVKVARRAGLLARPAAHVGRLVRRLLQLAARLGALPRRAVRHPPPLHDRPEPEGGQRRPPAPRGDRHPAALPGQGRGRRGGRDRLRRDDAGRGRGADARSSRWRVEHELPVLVHTPHRDKAAGTRKTIELVEASGIAPEMVLIDHNNELTVHDVLASGCWAGFSIYPGTKMDEHRMVRVLEEHGPERIIVNSACDWGVSDPLKVRKTADAMKAAGFDDDVIDQRRLAQPGRVLRPERAADPRRPGRAGPDGDVRGLAACCAARGREAAARRRQPAAPRLLLQRPPGRRPRRRRRAARALHGARARAARRARARHRPVGRGAGAGRRGGRRAARRAARPARRSRS